MMKFFISIDTYSHVPRKFFGLLKDATGRLQDKPITATVVCEDGMYKTFNFRSAKIRDDNYWNNKVVNPADYGHPMRDNDIAIGLHEWVSSKIGTDKTASFYFINEKEKEALDGFFRKVWNVEYPDIKLLANDYEIDAAISIPDEEFSRTIYMTGINKEEGQKEYTTDQKVRMLNSHRQYPSIDPSDMSLEKAHKMCTWYALLQHILKRYQ